MSHTHAGRGRPREARADERIIEATLALVRQDGPGAVSVAAVSARSGVARTTIYRRFADRRALLKAALQVVTHRGAPPGDMGPTAKVAWVLHRTAEVLRDGIGPGGLAAVLTDSDPEFGAALRAALTTGLEPVRQEIADDIERGTLPADLDPDLTLDLVLGTYVAELLRNGVPTERRIHEIAGTLSHILMG